MPVFGHNGTLLRIAYKPREKISIMLPCLASEPILHLRKLRSLSLHSAEPAVRKQLAKALSNLPQITKLLLRFQTHR